MTAKLAALIGEVESSPDCATCAWYQTLPADEREAFDRYIELSSENPRKYTRERLHQTCVDMGYPLKLTAFKDCVRRHRVHS